MKTGVSDSGLNLTHDRFRRLVVPVAPRAEQEGIVAAIEEEFSRIGAAVQGLEDASHAARMFVESARIELVMGGARQVGAALPDGWEWSSLGAHVVRVLRTAYMCRPRDTEAVLPS